MNSPVSEYFCPIRAHNTEKKRDREVSFFFLPRPDVLFFGRAANKHAKLRGCHAKTVDKPRVRCYLISIIINSIRRKNMKKTVRNKCRASAFFILFSMMIGLFAFVLPKTAAAETSGNENAVPFPVHIIQKCGSDAENRVMLFFGDGYTAAERDKFISDVTRRVRGMLSYEPFASYATKINIYAVAPPSEESGVSVSFGTVKNTYFSVSHYGKTTYISEDGMNKLRALRDVIEEKYLDKGGSACSVHILSNSEEYFGSAAPRGYFSYSSLAEDGENGESMTHEIGHAIGRLADEYGSFRENSVNISNTASQRDVPWRDFLGFRGVGITQGNASSTYIPSRSCIMEDIGNYRFCEVCKAELVRRLNDSAYTEKTEKIYVAAPDVTIEHSATDAIGSAYEKYRITSKNLLRAKGHDLEFRTVVQNLSSEPRTLKLTFRIISEENEIKLERSQTFEIPALSSWYDYAPARKSLSLVISAADLPSLYWKDRIEGFVTDAETGEVLATDKNGDFERKTLTVTCKTTDGKNIPNVGEMLIPLPENGSLPTPPQTLSGLAFARRETVSQTDAGVEEVWYYEPRTASEPFVSKLLPVSDYKSTDTLPTLNGSVFAGWFDDENCTEPYLKTDGSAYAKFIPAAVFSVKSQLRVGTVPTSSSTSLRLITTVDGDMYASVGFRVEYGGKTVDVETKTVYSSLFATDGASSFEYRPADICFASKYFATFVLSSVPSSAFSQKITVTPFVRTLDGSFVLGTPTDIVISEKLG